MLTSGTKKYEGGLILAKNVLQRHWDGTKFEEIHPVTKASNVFGADGKSIEQKVDAHLADYTSHVKYGIATGINPKVVTLTPAPITLVEGFALSFKNTTTNTGSVTLDINSLGAKPVVNSSGDPMEPDDLKAGSIYTVRYSGTSFILQGEGGGSKIYDVIKGTLQFEGKKGDRVITVSNLAEEQNDFVDMVNNKSARFKFSGDDKHVVLYSSGGGIELYQKTPSGFIEISNFLDIPPASVSDVRIDYHCNTIMVITSTGGVVVYRKNTSGLFIKGVLDVSARLGDVSFDGTYVIKGYPNAEYVTQGVRVYKWNGTKDVFMSLPRLPDNDISITEFHLTENIVAFGMQPSGSNGMVLLKLSSNGTDWDLFFASSGKYASHFSTNNNYIVISSWDPPSSYKIDVLDINKKIIVAGIPTINNVPVFEISKDGTYIAQNFEGPTTTKKIYKIVKTTNVSGSEKWDFEMVPLQGNEVVQRYLENDWILVPNSGAGLASRKFLTKVNILKYVEDGLITYDISKNRLNDSLGVLLQNGSTGDSVKVNQLWRF